MRTLHACAYVAFTALAVACGGGDSNKPDALIVIPDAAIDAFQPDSPPDAQVFDFSCMGNAAPTTAPATVAISGTASDINIIAMSLDPVENAAVKAFREGNGGGPDVQIGTTTSDAGGVWSLPTVPTSLVPVEGYVEATKTGHRTLRLYPPSPIAADIPQAPLLLIADATFAQIVQFTGNSQNAANGTVGLAVVDCANTPIGGATISVKQNGVEQGTPQDLSQVQQGLFLVFDVPPGETVVSASYMGMDLRAHTLEVLASTTSTTAVKPGF